LSMYAAPDMGPFSGAYAAGFFSLAEKSSLEKNLGPFCCHKNTSFCMTCICKGKVSLRIEMSGSIAPRRAPPSLEAADRAVTADNPIE